MKNENNIFTPLVDSVYDSIPILASAFTILGYKIFKFASKSFDCYGDMIYRIVEGKPYIGEIEANKHINIEHVKGNYEFIPLESVTKNVNSNVITYTDIEGYKEGLKACVGIDVKNEECFFLDALRGHILIGASTEWGKSNLMNIYLTNLIKSYTENEFKYMLCDFKNMDLVQFEKYKHCIGNCSIDKKSFLEQIKDLESIYKDRLDYIRPRNYLNVKDFNKDLSNNKKFPYILYFIDELPILAEDTDCLNKLTQFMRTCRAAGIYVILATQDARKKTIDSIRMLVNQVIGLHVATKTDSDTLIQEAELHKINEKGRFKIQAGGEIKEVQSFYLKAKEINEILKPFEVDDNKIIYKRK